MKKFIGLWVAYGFERLGTLVFKLFCTRTNSGIPHRVYNWLIDKSMDVDYWGNSNFWSRPADKE